MYRHHNRHVLFIRVPVLASHRIKKHLFGWVYPVLFLSIGSRNRRHFTFCAQRHLLPRNRCLLCNSWHVIASIDSIWRATLFVWCRSQCIVLQRTFLRFLLLLAGKEMVICRRTHRTLQFLIALFNTGTLALVWEKRKAHSDQPVSFFPLVAPWFTGHCPCAMLARLKAFGFRFRVRPWKLLFSERPWMFDLLTT